jgi:peptidoglycan/xylan/chitin deacetylase (PgdA/CDA1 family)
VTSATEVLDVLARRAKRAVTPGLRRLPLTVETGLRQLGRRLLAVSGRRDDSVHADQQRLSDPYGTMTEQRSTGLEQPATGGTPAGPRVQGCRLPARAWSRRAPTVILMYHRIAIEPDDPFGLAVRPERFAEQMAALHLYGEPVPLCEVIHRGRGPRIAVTLDDGYADNALVADELLRSADVPATVFVTSEAVGSAASLWPLRLEELFRRGHPAAGPLHLTIADTPLVVDLAAGGDRLLTMHRVHEDLRPRPPAEIAVALAALEQYFGGVAPDPGRRMLRSDELLALDASAVVTVGAHTRRHPWLSSLSATQQQEEIAGGRRDLEGLLGRSVDEFAYPFGSRQAFDGRSVRAARQAGFSLACATFPDPLVAGTSRFRLPRRQVLDWELPEFRWHLERWLAA